MATVDKLPSGKWRCQVRRKGQPAVSKTFRTRAAAVAWGRTQETAVDQGIAVDLTAQRTVFADVLLRYEREVAVHKKGWSKERGRLADFREALGALPLADLTPERVAGYASARLAAVGSDTVRRELALLSAVLQTAIDLWGIKLPENAARVAGRALQRNRQLKRKVTRERRLRPGEYRRLLAAASPTLRTLIRLAVETAMRRSELARLRPTDLRDDGLLITDDKVGKTSVIPLSKRARRLIAALPEKGIGLQPDSMTQTLARACTRAGIDDLRFHDLRHEGTSRLFDKGLSIEEVALITRHSDWRSLKVYTHITRARVADKLG